MERKRYRIVARRKDTNEAWTEWAEADSYKKAEEHARYCESVGYTSRIAIDEAVGELWRILGGENDDTADKTDEILDAGFCKESDVVRRLFKRIYNHFGNHIRKCDRAIAKAEFEEDAELLAFLEEKREGLATARRLIAEYGERYTGDSDEG